MIVIDCKSNKPIYEQIVEQMKYHILKGHLKPGDSIPSVRKLALDMAITPGTVARAYQELERQGIIETIRGKGTFIAASIELKTDEVRLEENTKLLRSVILDLTLMGQTEAEILTLVQKIYKEMSIC